jgi:hypothetical protein
MPSARRCFAVIVPMLLAMPAVSLAAAGAIDDLAAEQMTVRELMHLDTERALGLAKKALRKDGGQAQGSENGNRPTRSGELKLVAIYGVGKKLLAEVVIGAQPHVYLRGHPLPVGVKAGPSVYMLRGISGSCIQLERKEEAHTLCLPPSLWTAK